MDKTPQSADVELDQLISLFYQDAKDLGAFQQVEANQAVRQTLNPLHWRLLGQLHDTVGLQPAQRQTHQD